MYCGRFLALWMMIVLIGQSVGAADPISLEVQQELLRKADDWKVPQPAAMSLLVKIPVSQSLDRETGKYVDNHVLGFIDPNDSGRALVGFDWWNLKEHRAAIAVHDPSELTLNDIEPSSPFFEAHGVNFGLVTGIQLLRRGDQELGAALIAKGLAAYSGHPRSHFASPAGEAPVSMLARSCLANAVNRITAEKPDFARILSDIEMLLADQPKLRNEGTDWVLESLRANAEHQSPPAETVEAIIDDYLLCGSQSDRGSTCDAKRTLILKGFEAIPPLLLQRHSKRFSNHLMRGFNNFPSYPMTSGEVIDQYLQHLANGTIESSLVLSAHLEDDVVQSWWKNAQEMGEEKYAEEFVFTRDRFGNWSLSEPLLIIVVDRYPQMLPEIYRRMLKTSYVSWSVADEVMKSNTLSAAQKIQLMREAVATNNEAHRNEALKHLRSLDSSYFESELIRLLKQAPNSATKEYWTDKNAGLSRMVSNSDNPHVWATLYELIDRADLGMTMELIDHLYPRRDAPPAVLKTYHQIYADYQDDPTIRDDSANSKFRGPGAGFPHRRLALRDFIHLHWSRWLKTGIAEPKQGANDEEWTNYRAAVHFAVMKNYADIAAESEVAPLPKSRSSLAIGCVVMLCLAMVGIVVAKGRQK